jgi:hypothetical protein
MSFIEKFTPKKNISITSSSHPPSNPSLLSHTKTHQSPSSPISKAHPHHQDISNFPPSNVIMCFWLIYAAIRANRRAERDAQREAAARANPQVVYVDQNGNPIPQGQPGYPVNQQPPQSQLQNGPPGYEKQALQQNVVPVPVHA